MIRIVTELTRIISALPPDFALIVAVSCAILLDTANHA